MSTRTPFLRTVAFVLLVLMTVMPLVACGGPKDPEDTTTTPPTTTTSPSTPGIVLPPTPGAEPDIADFTLTAISAAELAGYRIVFPTSASSEIEDMAYALAATIREKTGTLLPVATDAVGIGEPIPTGGKEIRVGITNRNPELASLRVSDYRIALDGQAIVIAAHTAETLKNAITAYTTKMVDSAVKYPDRAYCAVGLYAVDSLTLAGEDISKFSIVRDAENAAVAIYLRDKIANLSGYYLPIRTDKMPATEYEIVIGNIARAGFTPPAAGSYAIATNGKKLMLSGVSTYAGYFATLAFLDSCLVPEGSGVGQTLAIPTLNRVAPHTNGDLFTLNIPSTLGSMAGKYDLSMDPDTVLSRFQATRAELPEEITVIDRISLDAYPFSLQTQVYVSPNGSDENDGSKEHPFATLQRAVDAMVNRQGGVIWMMEGVYTLESTVNLGKSHSGLASSPLFIKAYEGADVQLTSNKTLDTSEDKWEYLDPQSEMYKRIPSSARDFVMVTTLDKQGWTAQDAPRITTSGAPLIYVEGEEYVVARFPNDTGKAIDLAYFTHTYDTGSVSLMQSSLLPEWEKRALLAGQNPSTWIIGWEIRVLNEADNKKNPNSRYEYGEEILSWVNTGDIWYYGSVYSGFEYGYYNLALEAEGQYWAHDENGNRWTPSSGKTPYLGTPKSGGYYSLKSMTPCEWGCNPSSNSAAGRNTFYLFNAIEALDAPGEWFYDKETGSLYIYPKDEHDLPDCSASMSNVTPYGLVAAKDTSYMVIDGLRFDGCASTAVSVKGGSNVVIQDSVFCNTKGASLSFSATKSAIIYSDFSKSYSHSGVVLGGGSIGELTPSGILLQNNIFHGLRGEHALSWSGCRLVISHNYFNNCTTYGDQAVECIFEYNRFEGGDAHATDGGMIYISGAYSRGNHYRYNLFHMINQSHNAVYNDTQGSGNYMYFNIVSTLYALNDHSTGWYSSSGSGNVSYGNLMILRNPVERIAAGSNASIETDGVFARETDGDSILESALFFVDGGVNAYQKWNAVDYDGNPQRLLREDGSFGLPYSGATSECGATWYDFHNTWNSRYLSNYNTKAWQDRAPEYMNYIKVTQMLLNFHKDCELSPDDELDYHVKYFYVPWYLTGKSHTFEGVEKGLVITVPAYKYLVTEGGVNRYETVPARSFTVDGPFTLTYEEIAAMEKERRGPSNSVVMNNIILGGTPIYIPQAGGGFVAGDSDPSLVMADYCANFPGYMPTTRKTNNYLSYLYSDIVPQPYAIYDFDYSFGENAWSLIAARGEASPELSLEAAAQAEVREKLTGLKEKTGPTWELEYGDWFDVIYPEFDWDKDVTQHG